MLVIGLTGGIGSGKSTVANFFAELGVPIIDADQIAREVVAPGMPALTSIIEHFGNTLLQPDQTLDRKLLRRLVFNNPAEKNWLEALLHPLIRSAMQNKINQIKAPYCILVIPLLFESAPNPLITRILVVDVSPEIQKSRVMARDQLSADEADKIIHSQVSRETRLLGADDVIHNEFDLSQLKAQVLELHEKYLSLAPDSQ